MGTVLRRCALSHLEHSGFTHSMLKNKDPSENMSDNFFQLPKDLPVPLDDGAAAHLQGMSLVKTALPSTDGVTVDLCSLTGPFVIYIYPMTGRPDRKSTRLNSSH